MAKQNRPKNNQKKVIKTGFHRKKKTHRGNYEIRDQYAIKAQQEGYRARSVYKLFELQERFHLIKPHFSVLDIGAAPGSFLQAIAKIINNDQVLIGIDLKKIKDLGRPNVKTIEGSIFDYEFLKEKVSKLKGNNEKFDLITSDIAPNTTGRFDVDQYASVELNIAICEFSDAFLKEGGNMILKVFKGEDFYELSREVKKRFEKMKTYKPLACRDSSHEEYVICFNKKTNH